MAGWIPNLLDGLYSVSSKFGIRTDPFTGEQAGHTGYDFRTPEGTPISTGVGGIVTHAGKSDTGWGTYVAVQDAENKTHIFAHLDRVAVGIGEKIGGGTLIGLSGNTGRSTGAHLHYEVREGGKAIDPVNYLNAKGTGYNSQYPSSVFGNGSIAGESRDLTGLDRFLDWFGIDPATGREVPEGGVKGIAGAFVNEQPPNTIFSIPVPFADPIHVTKDGLFTVMLFLIGTIVLILALYSMFLSNSPAGKIVESVTGGE